MHFFKILTEVICAIMGTVLDLEGSLSVQIEGFVIALKRLDEKTSSVVSLAMYM